MPNPLFLQVMGIGLHEYNTYSPAKKLRFQKAATNKLAEVHETKIDDYIGLTNAAAKESNKIASDEVDALTEDEENS